MIKTIYDFFQKHIGLQGIKVVSTNVNNGIFQVFHHHQRMQTKLLLKKRRFVCDCDIEHTFDEQFEFLRKYQRQTVFYLYYPNLCKLHYAGVYKQHCKICVSNRVVNVSSIYQHTLF